MTNTPHRSQNYRPLRGADKVAALLLSINQPLAGRILKYFDPVELRLITRAAADLGVVPANAVENLVEEFSEQFTVGADLQGAAGEAEHLLAGVLPPEQVAELMSDVMGSANQSIWEKLSAIQESTFANYLAKEHPQTASLILSKVSPQCAAKVMGFMQRELRNQLMRRMLVPKPVADAVLRIIEATLKDDLLLNVARNIAADTHSRMADIINKMEREQMEDVLVSLAESKPKEAEILRGLLFTFDDIIKLSPRARTTLFDKVPTDKVVIALKGADPAFRDIVLSSLASRARRLVEHELNNGSSVPQRDILKARRAVADLALEMAERNEIELTTMEDRDDY